MYINKNYSVANRKYPKTNTNVDFLRKIMGCLYRQFPINETSVFICGDKNETAMDRNDSLNNSIYISLSLSLWDHLPILLAV